VIELVDAERHRQDRLKLAGRFEYTLDEPGLIGFEKLACLTEELGEVARVLPAKAELTHDTEAGDDDLKTELVQLVALGVAWLEGLL